MLVGPELSEEVILEMGTMLPGHAGQGRARQRFRLAMVGFVMALVVLPFSYRAERRLEAWTRDR